MVEEDLNYMSRMQIEGRGVCPFWGGGGNFPTALLMTLNAPC